MTFIARTRACDCHGHAHVIAPAHVSASIRTYTHGCGGGGRVGLGSAARWSWEGTCTTSKRTCCDARGRPTAPRWPPAVLIRWSTSGRSLPHTLNRTPCTLNPKPQTLPPHFCLAAVLMGRSTALQMACLCSPLSRPPPFLCALSLSADLPLALGMKWRASWTRGRKTGTLCDRDVCAYHRRTLARCCTSCQGTTAV